MALQPIPISYSIRDLQRNYREIIDTAKQSKDAVLLINNSRPEAVLLDVQTYDDLVVRMYPYDETYTLRAVGRSRASLKRSKAKKLESWDDLDA